MTSQSSVNRAFADLFEFGDGAERATDQTLNLLRASADLCRPTPHAETSVVVARGSMPYSAVTQPLARVATKGWHAIFHSWRCR
jgi:hypothetical protein